MIWHKSASQLAYTDMDEFLQAHVEEGVRLDYKLQRNQDLAKTISSFANTLGGWIILGVDEDRKTNKPIWPPQGKGMPKERGIVESLYNVANDIYPPVAIELSQVLDNPHVPDTCLVAVRINQSKDAPHAIEKGAL